MNRQLDATLRHVRPEAVAQYLDSQGYARTTERHGRGWLYVKDDEALIVPSNQGARDYSTCLLGVIEALARDGMTVDDVATQITVGICDVFRHKIADFDTATGSASLEFVQSAIEGLLKLVRFSAAGLLSQRAAYTDVPEEAKVLGRSCRFGQTERSSLVLKCYCPVNPLRIDKSLLQDEPFGRSVVRACMENIEFFTRADAAEPATPRLPTLNANVADAVAALQPLTEFAESTVSVLFVSLSPAAPSVTSRSITMDSAVHQRAGLVAKRLRSTDRHEEEKLYGYITDLHMDPPSAGAILNYEITLQVKYGTSARTLRVPLLQRQYSTAMTWQKEKREVYIRGVIDKGTQQWSVHRLLDFRPANQTKEEGDASSLF